MRSITTKVSSAANGLIQVDLDEGFGFEVQGVVRVTMPWRMLAALPCLSRGDERRVDARLVGPRALRQTVLRRYFLEFDTYGQATREVYLYLVDSRFARRTRQWCVTVEM